MPEQQLQAEAPQVLMQSMQDTHECMKQRLKHERSLRIEEVSKQGCLHFMQWDASGHFRQVVLTILSLSQTS